MSDHIPPSFYRAKIVEPLEIKGNYGYLTINNNLLRNSIFAPVIGGVEYKIEELVKVDGWGNFKIKIKRCDTALSDIDVSFLTKETILKVIFSPTGKIPVWTNI